MTSTQTTAPEATENVLSEIDLYLLAKPIAEALGDGWSEDEDEHNTGVDKAIRLIHTDGRAIGVRSLWHGRALQAFATGGPAPKPPAGTDDQPASDTNNRLSKGVRYSTGVRFTTTSPLHATLTAIRTVLLPAFDGHRPRLLANGTRIQPAPAVDAQPPAAGAPETKPRTSNTTTTTAKPKTTARRPASSTKRKTKPQTKPRRAAVAS